MRLIVLVGLAAGLSISAQFATAETLTENKVPVRVTSSAGKFQLNWFLSDLGPRSVRHSDVAGSRLLKAGRVEMLGQIVEVDHDVHRFGLHIGGRELVNPSVTLKPAEQIKKTDDAQGSGEPVPTSITPWVTVIRESAQGRESQVLAVGERLVLEGARMVQRPIRVQREYAFESASELINVQFDPRTVVGEPRRTLAVTTNQGSGTFTVGGAVLGEIVGFSATATKVYVVTDAQVRYEYDVVVNHETLSFTFAGKTSFADAADFLRTQNVTQKADVKLVTVKPCQVDLQTEPSPT